MARDVGVVRRIGLFGGSFDPVHNAHLALALHAVDELALDELRWIPVGHAWQKSRQPSAAVHREAMLRLAIADAPRQHVERCELLRPGPSYMLDTVRTLQAGLPDATWFLVIGQDQFAGLHTWHRHTELLQRVTLAVALRPHTVASAAADVMAAPRRDLKLPPMAVSASDIRRRVAAGLSIDGMVPAAVGHYIHEHRLYLHDTGS